MSSPIKLPPVPKIPQIPSIPRVPTIPVPQLLVAVPPLQGLISKVLNSSKLQLPVITLPTAAFGNIASRVSTAAAGINKAKEKAKLPLNTIARLKEQAESYKSKYTFDSVSASATAGLQGKLGAVKQDATTRIKTIVGV